MLVRGDSHRLDVVGGLPLARRLLHLLVGNVVAREFVANDESQAVFWRQVALVVGRKDSPSVPVFEKFCGTTGFR